MPLLWTLLGVVLVGLVVGAVLGARVLWSRGVRRYVIGLIAQREAVRAGVRALEGVVAALAKGSDEELVAFAQDEANEDRRSIEEISARMTIVADELQTSAYPKRLWKAADLLEQAARCCAEQSGKVKGKNGPIEVLEGLAAMDLKPCLRTLAEADAEMRRLFEVYSVEDPSVYGGGLYI